MSAITITDKGLSRKTYQEIRDELRAAWIATYGSAVDLSASSPDGHQIDLEASTISSIAELVQAVYARLNVDGASGIWLDIFASYRNMTRIGAAYSKVTAVFAGTAGTVVPEGTLIKFPGSSVYFVSNSAVTIGSDGTASVTCTAQSTGAASVDAGAWEMVSSSPDVTVSVTTAGTIGRDEENDAEFRVRIKDYDASGLATVDTMTTYITDNVAGITGCTIKENDTASTDSDGRPPFSFETIISGGSSDADIAAAILYCKPAGIKSYGTKYPEPGYPTNDSSGNTHYVNWTLSTSAFVWYKITIKEYSEEILPSDYSAQIKSAVVEWAAKEYTLGKDVIPQRVVIPVYGIPGILFVTVEAGVSYTEGTEPAAYTESRIAVGGQYVVEAAESRISVTLEA